MGKLILMSIFFIVILGCSKDDDVKDKAGIVITKKPQWVMTTTDDDSLVYTFMFKQACVFDNTVVVKSRKGKRDILRCLNLNDGSAKWEWSEFYEETSGIVYPYQYSNKLIWQERYYNYSINLETGKTEWKNISVEHYEYRSFGINDIFTVSHLVNRNKPIEKGGNIVIMDSKTGKPIFSFKPKYDNTGDTPNNECGWGYWGFPVPFTKDGKEYILIKFNDAQKACKTVYVEWLGLYNYTDKKWVYERQKLRDRDDSFTTATPSVIKGSNIYNNPTNAVVCHDLMTGQKRWETTGTDDNFTRLIVENGRVYVNGNNGNLTCLNADNGSKLWTIRSSGSSSMLSYLNGVVYFVGGGDGKLHAVDAETGEYLWKIESPDIKKNKWAIFSGMCAVVPGVGIQKGKIVVTTGLNAYCYEAIK
jgi:outer membrane protein assembly factor BamB